MAPKKGKKDASPAPEEAAEEEKKPEEDLGEQLDGHFQFSDNASYDGQYLKKTAPTGEDVCLHGEGTLRSGPETFKGTFEKGMYKYGEYTSGNGAVYQGSFRNNQFHGKGEYKWPDPPPTPRVYNGMWRDGVMHGRGQYRNFTFGTDTDFEGFSYRGSFSSNSQDQDKAKSDFVKEYGGECTRNALEIFQKLVEGANTAGQVPKEFLIPAKPTADGDEERPETAAEREAAEELFSGQFPDKDTAVPAALQAFAAFFAPEAEKLGKNEVVMEEDHKGRYGSTQLKRRQLEHIGQAVELSAPEGEAGISLVVLGNVSSQYDANEAKWKLIYIATIDAAA